MSRLPADDPRHGTRNGYTHLRCRCADCTEANTVYTNDLLHRRASAGLPPDDPRHGKYSTYTNYRCRCEACSQAGAERNRQNYLRRQGPVG